MIIRFYNLVGCFAVDSFDDIPEAAKELFSYMDYRQIIEPLVAFDLRNSSISQRACANRYGVDRQVIREIINKYSLG